MIQVVVAVIERADRRILIGQRRKTDTSPLKWEFPGGKVRDGEAPEAALARELREELNATVLRSVAIARVTHQYAGRTDTLEIQFYAVRIAGGELKPVVWEQTVWVLPR